MKLETALGGRLFLALLILALHSASFAQRPSEVEKLALPVLKEKLKHKLLTYLKQNHQTPDEYVLGKFNDHQIVFLGEYHRIKHDPGLVQRLLPRLYQNGIYHLGIEFGIYRDQPRVDKLINSPVYDEQAARDILFNWNPWWGYKEYMDIYRAAWALNRNLPSEAPRFRVLNLNASTDWSFVNTLADRNNPDVMKKVFQEGDNDAFMADVILKEIIKNGHKALIYSGMHHAFTSYKQPVLQDGKWFLGDFRTGNRIRKELGDRVFTICLHHPWSDAKDRHSVYPVKGVIDALLFSEPDLRPVGFDLAGIPFGELTDKSSLYQNGYERFTLKQYADGYIYTKPLSEYQAVTTDRRFLTPANIEQAIKQMPNPDAKARLTEYKLKMPIDEFMTLVTEEVIEHDANIRERFSRFW